MTQKTKSQEPGFQGGDVSLGAGRGGLKAGDYEEPAIVRSTFLDARDHEIINISAEGDVRVRGEHVARDVEFASRFTAWIRSAVTRRPDDGFGYDWQPGKGENADRTGVAGRDGAFRFQNSDGLDLVRFDGVDAVMVRGEPCNDNRRIYQGLVHWLGLSFA